MAEPWALKRAIRYSVAKEQYPDRRDPPGIIPNNCRLMQLNFFIATCCNRRRRFDAPIRKDLDRRPAAGFAPPALAPAAQNRRGAFANRAFGGFRDRRGWTLKTSANRCAAKGWAGLCWVEAGMRESARGVRAVQHVAEKNRSGRFWRPLRF